MQLNYNSSIILINKQRVRGKKHNIPEWAIFLDNIGNLNIFHNTVAQQIIKGFMLFDCVLFLNGSAYFHVAAAVAAVALETGCGYGNVDIARTVSMIGDKQIVLLVLATLPLTMFVCRRGWCRRVLCRTRCNAQFKRRRPYCFTSRSCTCLDHCAKTFQSRGWHTRPKLRPFTTRHVWKQTNHNCESIAVE